MYFLFSCKENENKIELQNVIIDENYHYNKFWRYIDIGDSIYATKSNINVFYQSMVYFDSAEYLATKLQNNYLLAYSAASKGSVYDAWNHEPMKTIEYFSKSVNYFAKVPDSLKSELYVRELLAHSFDKIQDSTNCISTLENLYNDILPLPDSFKIKLDFMPQMALVSTEVKNYDLAELILKNICKRNWIKNNPERYNFLTNYYLTKSRIDLYKYHKYNTPYIDSFKNELRFSKNPLDSIFICSELSNLYEANENYQKAFENLKFSSQYNSKLVDKESMNEFRKSLLQLEFVKQKKDLDYINLSIKNQQNTILLSLIALFFILIFLISTLRGRKKYRLLSEEFSKTNMILDQKIEEVNLANKEIQHRVKNNLQIIIGLLNMQQRKALSEETINSLQNAKLRIESIAQLYDQLSYNTNNVDFKKYVTHLMKHIIDCTETEYRVTTNLTIEDIIIPLNYNFSIGIILNEWITNSIKYANPKDDDTLILSLSILQSNSEVDIEYFDNGELEAQKDMKTGIGSQIVTLLTKQMNAKLLETSKSFHYKLKIPIVRKYD